LKRRKKMFGANFCEWFGSVKQARQNCITLKSFYWKRRITLLSVYRSQITRELWNQWTFLYPCRGIFIPLQRGTCLISFYTLAEGIFIPLQRVLVYPCRGYLYLCRGYNDLRGYNDFSQKFCNVVKETFTHIFQNFV